MDYVACSQCACAVEALHIARTQDNKVLCYPCASKQEEQDMIKNGTAVLYLVRKLETTSETLMCEPKIHTLRVTTQLQGFQPGKFGNLRSEEWRVQNWTGHLMFRTRGVARHKINGIERERITLRFIGPDGKIWAGVQRGYSHDLIRCKRTKFKHIREEL